MISVWREPYLFMWSIDMYIYKYIQIHIYIYIHLYIDTYIYQQHPQWRWHQCGANHICWCEPWLPQPPTQPVSHDSFIRVTWLIHTCDMTHSCRWLKHWCITHFARVGCTYAPHSYAWHDSFIRVTWLIHTCGMTYSYVWHDLFICVTWLIHTCDMTPSYV